MERTCQKPVKTPKYKIYRFRGTEINFRYKNVVRIITAVIIYEWGAVVVYVYLITNVVFLVAGTGLCDVCGTGRDGGLRYGRSRGRGRKVKVTTVYESSRASFLVRAPGTGRGVRRFFNQTVVSAVAVSVPLATAARTP